ncbi:UDP-Glycosyltransferase/glycogen phosphorylase [Cutaneotrichosporon oleaginosum]|uniref:UDP-Glycosyltransferase/glycogen phosphorylase n=1 Tax=Cutaneotrichosporon oleaginosum TaxID=879819 RepID=A0A0J1BAR8_9TREE|nr:UDP-Glycosyltransferase/glycogen phosphorylase [Cutaneotrichosporon oleaginosum]KLT45009.1 UDP-Glycosyltransferase/glycogen phosphorylase [Cutaneotrichosporon oleaginosum]TXT09697.1 hypothetical protein COLE_03631 [Cutaneotrichosporon oleaginosum]
MHAWHPGMSRDARDAREAWISGGRGRSGLRIVIVTENFLPKVDGVTRTLARLLEHLEREGHQCMLLGPGTGMSHYASHPLVGTAGVPLVVYPGLKLNFLRPKFLRVIQDFEPDVVHFVDPIWLGAQTLVALELGWAGQDWVGDGGPAIGTGISGAVVASYHTNLATYATLFGLSWLEPVMWRLQQWLYSKTKLTLCPSPSTRDMLESQSFANVRLWPRGVDLSHFSRAHRCPKMRASWGVGDAPDGRAISGLNMPLTPPASPTVSAAGAGDLPSRNVLLYVGRVSWEKNLVLLLRAYGRLRRTLPPAAVPKLVFVGDGPARPELESICAAQDLDATFMGHRSGAELAQCYASADVFAFPSFTETFGQVVLEALASGLPVVGLDAEGTRDLVAHRHTGLLLPLPPQGAAAPRQGDTSAPPSRAWPAICRDTATPLFDTCVEGYAALLAEACTLHTQREAMAHRACTQGIVGYTWWDAMERCVDGYREAMRMARANRHVSIVSAPSAPAALDPAVPVPAPTATPRISRVNRALSRRLAHRQFREAQMRYRTRAKSEAELAHFKTLAKALLVALAFWWIWTRHLASNGRVVSWDELFTPA